MSLMKRFGRGGRPLRIAYGRIFHEANAFSPLLTERVDFERFHFLQGETLAKACRITGHELKGFLRQAELSGMAQAANIAGNVETLPLVSALAVSGGPISAEAFAWLRETLRERLRAVGPLDGLYLALHGSMRVQGMSTAPEATLLEDARRIVGDTPIAVSYDLHANLSPEIVDPVTVLTAFHTNPHRDLFGTGFRAGSLLIKAARGFVRPTHAWRKLPMLLGGGLTIDFLAPMRRVFRRLRAMERKKGVLSANLFMVHCFSDAKDLGWAAHVATDNDPELADRLSDELAELLWSVRDAPMPDMKSPRAALQEVGKARLSRATGTISLVDVDDAVGTGAPGCNTHLLAEFVQHPQSYRIYLPIFDPCGLKACWDTPLGSEVSLVLGGLPEMGDQPKVPVRGVVKALVDTKFGRVARLDVGALSVAITERPPYSVHPSFWRELGLSPWKADAIVQKALFHYRFFYGAVSRKTVPVVSGGASSLENVKNLRFDLPVWPNQPVEEWRTFDEIRRGCHPA